MKVTEAYRNNIRAMERFLHTISFSEESEARIKQYMEDPLSVVNDDIKALFAKYDDKVVDYRIELPSSMLTQTTKYPKELYIVLNTITDCLINDDVIKFTSNDNSAVISNITLDVQTVANNYFLIGNDKRKVWKYLDSKSVDIAKNALASSLALDKTEIYLDNAECKLSGYFQSMTEYLDTLGSRKTSLRDKINSIFENKKVQITDNTDEVLNKVNSTIKMIFKVMSEIVGAKLVDTNKFKMYLSFNTFDWLLASTGETFHSCIDMASTYNYGLGLLGMCGCPDWGMLLYTDDTKKTCYGIESLHIITRSWVCYLDTKEFQVVNWYPKDLRSTVSIENAPIEGIRFKVARDNDNSKSSWKPITFCNGGVSWIYSDLNEFIINPDKETVHFKMSGRTGINGLALYNEKLINNSNANSKMIEAIGHSGYHSIGDAVDNGYRLKDSKYVSQEDRYYTCDKCGNRVESDEDLTYIEAEDIYVCNECLENDYYWCEGCEEYHIYDDSYEVYYGNENWQYELRCNSCVEDNENVFWDEVEEKFYFSSSVNNYTLHCSDKVSRTVSEYTLNKLIEEKKAFKWSDETFHEEEEGAKE